MAQTKHELNLMLEKKRILERELEKRIFNRDYRRYFRQCLKIKDKKAQIIAFDPNIGQEKIINVIEAWKEKYPNPEIRPTLYIIILKARQIGYSTCVEGIMFHDITHGPNLVGMVVSYDDDSAKNINDMSNRYYQYLPADMKSMTRPARGKGIFFENPYFNPYKPAGPDNEPGLQSKFLIETAANQNAGSSYTINYLHLSELAKWTRDIKITMTSLLQAVPQTNAVVFIESTAKGFNYFKDLWDDAVAGRNDYVPIFTSWLEHAEYQMPLEQGESLSPYDKEEIDLLNIYNASLEQLKWRRWCIKNKCSSDVNQFHQEYPSCPEEAFLATGTPVFDNEKVIIRKRMLEEKHKQNPPLIGSFYYEYDEVHQKIIDSTIEFRPDPHGNVKIFEMPVQGRPYVLGGDIAEGGFDMSSGQMLNNVNGKQVARYWYHTDTDLYAKDMYCIGMFYNKALLSIEVNFDTHPIKELSRLGYPNLYRRQVLDTTTERMQDKEGFLTTKVTRPLIIADLVTISRENIELIEDEDTLNEMLTMIRDNVGKPDHETGKRNDLVFGLAIAHKSRSQQSMKDAPPPVEQLKGWWTRDELEDKGYSKWEIEQIIADMRPWRK
jgi:hypothetical protein